MVGTIHKAEITTYLRGVDVNIWIDIAARPKQYPESAKLLRRMLAQSHEVCIALSCYTTIHYVLGRILTSKAAAEFLYQLDAIGISLISFSAKDTKMARMLRFKDFEDACIVASAVSAHCDYIISRNYKDFTLSPVPVLSVVEAMKKI